MFQQRTNYYLLRTTHKYSNIVEIFLHSQLVEILKWLLKLFVSLGNFEMKLAPLSSLIVFISVIQLVQSTVLNSKLRSPKYNLGTSVYNFGPCYGPVVENNRSFTTSVYARVYATNHSLEWWPTLNQNALNYDNKTTDNINVVCGPTGDFLYACQIDRLSCSTDLELVYAMCNAGNIFRDCINHTNTAKRDNYVG